MLPIKKKRGRPCKDRLPKNNFYTFRFNDEELSKFEAVIKNRGLSRSEFIRNAISDAWNKDFLH